MRFQDYDTLFRTALGAREAVPHDFQRRFAVSPESFDLVRAPTGSGKTEAILLGWVYRRFGPDEAIRRATPRRLVYCLPMRTLVEQTHDRAVRYLSNLGLFAGRAEFEATDRAKVTGYTPAAPAEAAPGTVAVHLLLGGNADDDWTLTPERDAILIGTQEMLLSRALNRGYARSRFQWPIDFGLLNNDCLWVFDELQLMGSGVSTSAQLAGLRDRLTTFGPVRSVWMSATMDRNWLRTVDLRERVDSLAELTLTETELTTGDLGRRMMAKKTLRAAGITSTNKGAAKAIAEFVKGKHHTGTLTLVVLNTVNRAKDVFTELGKALKKAETKPEVLLIHSRFRPAERATLNEALLGKALPPGGRIVVATQVIEAGVDLSARVLIIELAPWSSVIQRLGRCHRNGEPGWDGEAYWLDVDEEKAAPYQKDDLAAARRYLTALDGEDVSPKALADFRYCGQPVELTFEHVHVVRRRDLLDLFDTAPDLSGNDIDVSRFVRGDEPETDVQVFWRADAPSNEWDADERRRQAARREELCSVPIGSFKKEFLEAGKTAYRLDHLDGEWRPVGKKDAGTVVPGQTFWIPADQGGYVRETGWSPGAGQLPAGLLLPLPNEPPRSRRRRPEGAYDSDEWSVCGWRTVAEHTDEVVRELALLLDPAYQLPLTEPLLQALAVAARWHDWGKMHPVFQSGIAAEIDHPEDRKSLPEGRRRKVPRPGAFALCDAVAKAPDEFWQRYSRVTRPHAPEGDQGQRRTVRRFRHELASVFGVITLRSEGRLPPDWTALPPEAQAVALYVIAAHHGKVRVSVRTMPDEAPIPPEPDRLFAAGLWDGDTLPASDLGLGAPAEPVMLRLAPMRLGHPGNWAASVFKLRDSAAFGPLRLAYLEAILRAADCRASAEADQERRAGDA